MDRSLSDSDDDDNTSEDNAAINGDNTNDDGFLFKAIAGPGWLSEIDSESLIMAVNRRPAIWDKRNPAHRNRRVINKSWKEIGVEMQVDNEKLRRKWKYLRDQFSNELGKAEDSGKDSTWPYFPCLMFLMDVCVPRRKKGPPTKKKTVDPPPSKEKTKRKAEKRKVKKEKCEEEEDEPEESPAKFAPVTDSDHLHFFKSLLPYIRQIPPSKTLLFRSEVNNLIVQYAKCKKW